jgi:hypothetical protein
MTASKLREAAMTASNPFQIPPGSIRFSSVEDAVQELPANEPTPGAAAWDFF